MSPGALTSEQIYEADRSAKIEWGRSVRDQMNRACKWFQDAGVRLTCN